jgi:hypothetical protein
MRFGQVKAEWNLAVSASVPLALGAMTLGWMTSRVLKMGQTNGLTCLILFADGICCLFDHLLLIRSSVGLPGSIHVPTLDREALPAGRGDKRRAFMVREHMPHKTAV